MWWAAAGVKFRSLCSPLTLQHFHGDVGKEVDDRSLTFCYTKSNPVLQYRIPEAKLYEPSPRNDE